MAAILILYLWLSEPVLAELYSAPRENLRDAGAFLQKLSDPDTLIVGPVVGPFLRGHYLSWDANIVNLKSAMAIESEAQNYQRAYLLQTRYSQLTPDNAPWLTPDNLVATFPPGVAIYRIPSGEEAREWVQKRTELMRANEDEISAEELRLMAEEARKFRDHRLVIDILERLVRASPQDSGAWTELGLAYRQVNRTDDAIAAYEKAIETNPNNAWAHLLLANVLRQTGDPRAALPHAETAVQIAADVPGAWTALGFARLELGDNAGAREAFARGLKLNADDMMLNYGMALVASEMNEANASDLWRALLETNPPTFIRKDACQHLNNDHPSCANP